MGHFSFKSGETEKDRVRTVDQEANVLERVCLKAQHRDSVTVYQVLLKDKIKDPEVATLSCHMLTEPSLCNN
ncbi:unnamed protein product [Sphagnum tenellum]